MMHEQDRIEREIESVSDMWLSPYRKGIIAGLIERKGETALACPYRDGTRAAKNWQDGRQSGLTRSLVRYGDPDWESGQ